MTSATVSATCVCVLLTENMPPLCATCAHSVPTEAHTEPRASQINSLQHGVTRSVGPPALACWSLPRLGAAERGR